MSKKSENLKIQYAGFFLNVNMHFKRGAFFCDLNPKLLKP